MSTLPRVLELGWEDEARRLWAGALECRAAAEADLVSLCESLDLGLHATEILAVGLLQHVRGEFPATIGLQLELPDPDVDPQRDGTNLPNTLQFHDVLDLLSDEELECVSPGLHRGWEDRRFSCRRSRVTAHSAIGLSLSRDERSRLLSLGAYRNRLFRYPPPVRVVPGDILEAWPSLERLVVGLLQALA